MARFGTPPVFNGTALVRGLGVVLKWSVVTGLFWSGLGIWSWGRSSSGLLLFFTRSLGPGKAEPALNYAVFHSLFTVCQCPASEGALQWFSSSSSSRTDAVEELLATFRSGPHELSVRCTEPGSQRKPLRGKDRRSSGETVAFQSKAVG